MYEQMRPTYGRRPQPWMVLHHNRDARLATVLKPWAPSAGWSSDEPIRKGSTTRSSPVGPNGLMGSSRHCHFLTWGGLLASLLLAQVYLLHIVASDKKAQFTKTERKKEVCNWFGSFTHLSWSMSFFLLPLTLKGSNCGHGDGKMTLERAKGWTLATGRHSCPCDRRG